MKYDVFISYSRKDTKIADRIYGALARAGVSCFIDRKDISGGKEFTDVIMDAIDNSALFLFLGSSNSYSAKYAPLEAKYAFDEKEPNTMVPYLIDNTPLPKKFRFYFGAINIRNIKEHPIETVLVKDILDLLGRGFPEVQEANVGKVKKDRSHNSSSLRAPKISWNSEAIRKMVSGIRESFRRLVKEKHPVVILLYILQVAAIIAMLTIPIKLFSSGYVSKPFDWFLNRGKTWWLNLAFMSAAVGMLFATLMMFGDRKKAFYAVCVLDIIVGISIMMLSVRIFGVAKAHPKTYGTGAEMLYANLKYAGYVLQSHGLKPIEVIEKIACYLLMPIHMLVMWAGLHIKKDGRSAWSLMK